MKDNSFTEKNVIDISFLNEIRQLVVQSRQQAYAAINQAMITAYWKIGQRIVEEEQKGSRRAEYGQQLLKQLSAALTKEFGKGFSVGTLYYIRQFYVTFPEIFATPWRILSWSHYKRIMQVPAEAARNWYLKEASEQMWSYKTLNRNIGTQYYERMLLSQKKEPVEAEMKSLTKDFDNDKFEYIKNPLVAEFLGMSPSYSFVENELEKAILDNLQKFLLELGKGFSFVERQKLIRTEKNDYFIARYMLNDRKNVFMSKYLLCLPTKEELRKEIENQKELFALQQADKNS